MTTVAIHQPQYLPWLPYIDKADRADLFVYLDTVQYQKNGVQNRNQIKTAQGATWLTIPIHASSESAIADVKVGDQKWQKKHLQTLKQSYARAAHADRLESLAPIFLREWDKLVEVAVASTEWLFAELGVAARRVRASGLPGLAGQKDDLVLSVCKAVGATRYLSGRGAAAYQDAEKFARAGVELVYQSYEPQAYAQVGAEYLPQLSAIDLVLNHGPAARDILVAGRRG